MIISINRAQQLNLNTRDFTYTEGIVAASIYPGSASRMIISINRAQQLNLNTRDFTYTEGIVAASISPGISVKNDHFYK